MFPFCPHCGGSLDQQQIPGQMLVCAQCRKQVGVVPVPAKKVVIDEIKRRMDDLALTMQRLVPTARVGAVAYRDRDDGNVATAPRQSEDFLVKWKVIAVKVPANQLVTNELVDEMNKFDAAQVTAKAVAYK